MSKLNIRFGTSVFGVLFLLAILAVGANAQTYTTIADGSWNSGSTWLGGAIPPTGSDIPVTAVINIRHTVAYNTGNPLKNRGEIRIEPIVGTTAQLTVPTGINIENLVTGQFYIVSGSLIQCRFAACNNGEPYSGNNPGGFLQSGTFKNIGGFMQVSNATVEIAQDWTNESGGDRTISDSCVKTGQNFSLSGFGSTDQVTRSQISIGWHGSGSFEHSDGTTVYDQMRVQLAGTSGSFKLNSGTVNGDIDTIQLRNQVVPFNGGGEISASSSVVTAGVNLDEYCASTFTQNGKFVGSRTQSCANESTLCFAPLAAGASVDGRVMTARGMGIRNVVVELAGGGLETPLRTLTSPFGYFRFENVPVGSTYIVSVANKRYTFEVPSRVITLEDNFTGLDFMASPEGRAAAPLSRGKR